MNLIATTWLDRPSGLELKVAHFDGYGGMVFAVKNKFGDCLNKEGDWETEPFPSNRTPEFIARCRWNDFTEAANALEKAAANLSEYDRL